MTKISFKPVDTIRETYEPSHYKNLNQTRPAFKLKLRNLKLQTIQESQKSVIFQKPKILKLTCTALCSVYRSDLKPGCQGTIKLARVLINWRIRMVITLPKQSKG